LAEFKGWRRWALILPSTISATFSYVEDVDKTVERAVAGGAKILFPVANQFWGDRIGWVMLRTSRKPQRSKGGSGGQAFNRAVRVA
jgi:hypothetical protein